jgi:hypothetical protein
MAHALISQLVVVVDGLRQRKYSSNLAMFFWRATCDLGLSTRFILTMAFNRYVCDADTCRRVDDDDAWRENQDRCRFPGSVLQFFLVASEMWFLCNAIDLYFSITNPFSSFKTRIKYYHIVCWTTALLVCLVPLALGPHHKVYGFWYVNYHIEDSNICWLRTGHDKLGFSVWALFLVPLAVIYVIGLISLVVAYTRLRKGLTRTFLPKMKLLVTNTINVLVLAMFWGIFLILYASAFLSRHENNYTLNSLLYFTLASKGFSCLFVWIFVSDYNLNLLSSQQDEAVDANVALREEVLTFATAGIRSSARTGALATEDKAEIVRRPEQARLEDANLIGMLFYFKFLMGYSEEIRAVEKMISRKRRSINDSFHRQTVLQEAIQAAQDVESHRMSQRPTVLTGEISQAERATELGTGSVVDMVEVQSMSAPKAPGNSHASLDMQMHVSEVANQANNPGSKSKSATSIC